MISVTTPIVKRELSILPAKANLEIMKINISEKLASLGEMWSPRLAATVNDTDVKLVKLLGEFVWHHHEKEDELFLVLKGRLLMQFRDHEEWIEEGRVYVVKHLSEPLNISEGLALTILDKTGNEIHPSGSHWSFASHRFELFSVYLN